MHLQEINKERQERWKASSKILSKILNTILLNMFLSKLIEIAYEV